MDTPYEDATLLSRGTTDLFVTPLEANVENAPLALPSDIMSIARAETAKLEKRYENKFKINRDLSRSLVSFQANKTEAVFRWFKYREGFSKPLVEYIFSHANISKAHRVLDPFAGTAATCFVANEHSIDAVAIELLPVGCHFIKLRNALKEVSMSTIALWVREVLDARPWEQSREGVPFKHLKITQDAFPPDTENYLATYRSWVADQPYPKQAFCDFLSYSILEDISFTRKDGQYLRWDQRSARSKVKGTFNKGKIYSFEEAISAKCNMILDDAHGSVTNLFPNIHTERSGNLELYEGTNFSALQSIDVNSIDLVVTSPPYCNRYDYTRTYALELAYLECGEDEIRKLRQSLLSCTVENRPKKLEGVVPQEILSAASVAFNSNKAIQSVLDFLANERKLGKLNNNGIVTMVRGYFFEMAIHIAQLSRVVRPGGSIYLVNDNVRYNGLDIPVDCILSEFAEQLGFNCREIWVLPMGKGNSSQQMKLHGRSELRKCVYIWERQVD